MSEQQEDEEVVRSEREQVEALMDAFRESAFADVTICIADAANIDDDDEDDFWAEIDELQDRLYCLSEECITLRAKLLKML